MRRTRTLSRSISSLWVGTHPPWARPLRTACERAFPRRRRAVAPEPQPAGMALRERHAGRRPRAPAPLPGVAPFLAPRARAEVTDQEKSALVFSRGNRGTRGSARRKAENMGDPFSAGPGYHRA